MRQFKFGLVGMLLGTTNLLPLRQIEAFNRPLNEFY